MGGTAVGWGLFFHCLTLSLTVGYIMQTRPVFYTAQVLNTRKPPTANRIKRLTCK
jgi:hypothetical protein